MLIVITVLLVIVVYLLWVIAYNQQTMFGRYWLPRRFFGWRRKG